MRGIVASTQWSPHSLLQASTATFSRALSLSLSIICPLHNKFTCINQSLQYQQDSGSIDFGIAFLVALMWSLSFNKRSTVGCVATCKGYLSREGGLHSHCYCKNRSNRASRQEFYMLLVLRLAIITSCLSEIVESVHEFEGSIARNRSCAQCNQASKLPGAGVPRHSGAIDLA